MTGVQEEAKAIKQAEREGWATHMPAPAVYAAGVLAALLVMLSPFVMYAVVAIVAVFGELIRQGWVSLYGTVYVNMRSFAYYVQLEWPFILGGAALGLPLAYLRQRHGFYLRRVRGNQYRYVAEGSPASEAETDEGHRDDPVYGYTRKFMLPIYPHVLVLWLAGPLFMIAMAYHADPHKYPRIVYNMFAVWLTSGVVARIVWERLQVAILKLMARKIGGPRRNLSAEYQLKRVIEEDPALSDFSVWDVEVSTKTRRARVFANIEGEGPLRRLRELAAWIEGVDSVQVVAYTAAEARGESVMEHG